MGANIIIFRINQIPTQLLNNHKYSLNCANIFMNMRKTITIVAIAMLTLGISLSAGAQSKNRSADQEAQELEKIKRETTILKEGDKAADFTGKRFAGGSFKLGDQKGKVVMLLFWGGWCPPCRHELRPENLPATLKEFNGNQDFVFQPIAYKDTRATLEKFFAGKEGKTIYSYLKPLTLVDEDKSIFGLYAKSGVPRCVIIGKNGVIAYVGIGSSEEGLKEVAQTLREELAK